MCRRLAVLVVLALAAALPGAASAAVCGTKDAKTGKPAVGQLSLNEASRTDLVYRRSVSPKAIMLVFDVKGCTISRDQRPVPGLLVTPTNGPGADLPDDALMPVTSGYRGGTELEYRFDVDTDKLDPGSYNGAIELRSSYLRTTRTPVSVSRSEHRWLVPVGFGALGGLAGISWFLIVSAASSALPSGTRWAWLVGAAGLVFGGIAGYGFWTNQDVWTMSDNAWATIVAGFTGATTGALAALTTQLVKQHSDAADAVAAAAGAGAAPAAQG
jgi:hypothetical protein